MSLTDLYDTAKETNIFVAGKCVVGQWAVRLPASDQEAFNNSINDDDFSSRSLFDLYKSAGATFSLTSLKEHRNEKCACL